MTDSRWCRSCLATVKKKKKKGRCQSFWLRRFSQNKKQRCAPQMFPVWSSSRNHINGFNINQKQKNTQQSLFWRHLPHRHSMRWILSLFGISLHRNKKARFVYYWVCFFRGKWELCHIQRSARATAYSVQEYIAFLGKYLCLLCV